MEDFRWTYLQLCKEGGVEPQESVVAQLQESRAAHSSRLDLSGHSLSTDTCSVLARAFQKDGVFTEVSLSDCMLTEEGVYDCRPCWLYDVLHSSPQNLDGSLLILVQRHNQLSGLLAGLCTSLICVQISERKGTMYKSMVGATGMYCLETVALTKSHQAVLFIFG